MPALMPGAILIGIGALFLLGNLHIVRIHDWLDYWPVILIAIGMVHMVDARHSGGRAMGAVLMAAGGLLLADNLGYLKFRIADLWPLLLIGAGLMMLWSRTGWGPRERRGGRHGVWGRRAWVGGWPPSGEGMEPPVDDTLFSGNAVHEFAIFGGTRRIVTAQDFKGGRIACAFGGVVLDLTGAGMAGNKAVLEIATMWGGATVRIPPSWDVEMRGAGIFGGFGDHTIHPPSSPDMKRLIVKGAAVFGGVTVKN
jgi:predicted membrane protein